MSVDFSNLKGLTFTSVERVDRLGWSEDEGFVFITDTGRRFELYHSQSCCESVFVKDVVGDLSDLIGSEILTAEHRWEDLTPPQYGDYHEYNFYELRTLKGSVTIQFEGSDNGYYGRDATLYEVKNEQK